MMSHLLRINGTGNAAECEGATGSLATLAPNRSPSHPRSTAHGSRLPAISRRELQVDGCSDTTPRSILGKPHQKNHACDWALGRRSWHMARKRSIINKVDERMN